MIIAPQTKPSTPKGVLNLASSKNLSFILHFIVHSESIHGADTGDRSFFHLHLPSLLRQSARTPCQQLLALAPPAASHLLTGVFC